MELIYEKSKPGRRASTLPSYDLPAVEVPEELRRAEPPRLPELAEPEVMRHFTALSTRNFGIDTGFYPLGSCTMKHNPRVNERVVMLPGFKDLHPYQEESGAQGALELMWRLQEILAGGRRPRRLLAAAGRGIAGRADGADADARLLRGSRRRRAARHDRHRRHGARDEPGERDDGRLQAREGRHRCAREPRPRRSARRR